MGCLSIGVKLMVAFFGLIGVISFISSDYPFDKTASFIFVVIAGILALIDRSINRSIYKKKADKQTKQEQADAEALHLAHQIDAVNRGELPIIHNTPVILAPGEVAHLSLNATRLITKNKAVGRTGGGSGVSFRVAKGVSVRTGGGASKTIYEDVTSTYKGMLIVTNKRIIFINSQQGFEHKLSSVSSLFVDKANVELQVKSKSYTFITAGAMLLQPVIQMITGGKEPASNDEYFETVN